MKGAIIINPFFVPTQSVEQAKRLKEEFSALSVETDIVSDGCTNTFLDGEKVASPLFSYDFAVYLDKDKYLSEILEKNGVRVFNSHNAIRVCDDKARTYITLCGKGLNLPKTVFGALCYDDKEKINEENLKKIAKTLCYPVIVKESYGSMGKGVYLAENFNSLKEFEEKVKIKPHLFQEYLGKEKGTDYRIIVIGNKVITTIKRVNKNDFRSNVFQGGKGEKVTLPENYIAAAERASSLLGLDYCGVDIITGSDGSPYIAEVNSNAFFFETERVTGVNVARLYAEYIIKTLKNR